ncbi:sensor histidine kinase [Entomobacter blattae]|uniref:histidine kinase n=1 Tax=Entomobacter blattae TaxID=2762277 RepID=A0A7H1NUV6_9PROT|nr:ATP-binding protein [Entomobacter blattae]QNT79566.1 hypothetical protein JGUZn3_23660 [Entomobacter blattae]
MPEKTQHNKIKDILLIYNDSAHESEKLCQMVGRLSGYSFDICSIKEFYLKVHRHKKYDGFLIIDTHAVITSKTAHVFPVLLRKNSTSPLICVLDPTASIKIVAKRGVDSIIPLSNFSAELFDMTFRFICARKVSQKQQEKRVAQLEQRLAEYNGQYTEMIENLHQRDVKIKEFSDYIEQIERLNSLGKITSSVVHDFSNVLSSLNGGLDMLKRRLEQKKVFSDSVKQTYALIADTIPFGERMLKSLLSYVDNNSSQKDVIDLNNMVSTMVPILTMIFGRSVRTEFMLAKKMSKVQVSRSSIERAILNLAINARDAMQESKKREFLVSTQVRKVKGQTFSFLKIEDSGPGMAEEVMKRACLPFYSTKQPGKGTGLGLAQVHDFVEESKGILAFRNRACGGLEVSMGFPAVGE